MALELREDTRGDLVERDPFEINRVVYIVVAGGPRPSTRQSAPTVGLDSRRPWLEPGQWYVDHVPWFARLHVLGFAARRILTVRQKRAMLSRMERLIEYLNTGETLALVGAGVSRELGIPTWKELCDKLLARIPPQFEKRKDEPVRLLKAEAYDAFTGWISRNVGPEFLYENTREILADAGRTGSVSEFVAKYPFKSVFTTNFDNSLKRHFNAVG
ncbi:MAG: hypothetical protein WD229_13695, partial [Pirellulales bacterium]